ncbi:Uncharacterised protein [Enterobacter cloacae]|nr:Uncharacterised protein [Enterobacter cloacae]
MFHHAGHQVGHTHTLNQRVVVEEGQLRHNTQTHRFAKQRADETRGFLQRFNAVLHGVFILVIQECHKHFGVRQVAGHFHARHGGHHPHAWIFDFTLQNESDLFLHLLRDALWATKFFRHNKFSRQKRGLSPFLKLLPGGASLTRPTLINLQLTKITRWYAEFR